MDKKKYQILLVEDESDLRELYERVLLQGGLDVICAIDGRQGYEMAQRKPDLILLDIMMPYINGIELLKKLKGDPKTADISIVLLTNLGQEDIIREALKHGAQGYLMKMRLSPYDLVERVKEFLGNPDMRTDFNNLDLD